MSPPSTQPVLLDGPIGPLSCRVRPAQPGAPVLVLLHGIQGTGAAWDGICARLPDGWGYAVPDLRGRGLSAAPDDPAAYSLAGFAQDLGAVIDACPGPVVLVGWSMGVLVALSHVAAAGTGRLAGLVLASGTACPGADARWFQGTTAREIGAEAQARAERLALSVYARPEAVAGAWMAARQADLRPVLAQVDVPTLVIHGSADDQCPLAHGETLAAGIPGARLSVWPQGGHNLMAEDPAGFTAALVDFIHGAEGTPGRAELRGASAGEALDGSSSF